MILIIGFYGPFNIQLGPNSSFLIETNPFFVDTIKVIFLYTESREYGFLIYILLPISMLLKPFILPQVLVLFLDTLRWYGHDFILDRKENLQNIGLKLGLYIH